MGLLIKDRNGIYDDAAIPQAYDKTLGAYRDAESALVRDGEIWREVWPERPEILYLYKGGDECMDVTGGWSGKGLKHVDGRHIPTAPIVTKNRDNIYFAIAEGGIRSGGLYTNKPVDLTPYKKMVAVVSGTIDKDSSAIGSCNIRMDFDAYFDWDHNKTILNGYGDNQVLNVDRGTYELDMEGYSGLWYPGLYIANATSGKVGYMQLWELYLM